ncbi:MAG: tRNA epoxyqueuosine(34) reductase QueG [Polaromonas sp.]|nr:MAG: tRNA epoxyqueuosine(34) reductase QueG [Polaromonas sp.]
MQRQRGVAKRGPRGQVLGKGLRGGFVQPCRCFYNQGVEPISYQVSHQVNRQIDHRFASQIQTWALELGFSQIGIAGVDLSSAEPGLSAWLAAGFHGDMHYMAAHGLKRARPAELVPGTVSVITARMDYLPGSTQAGWQALEFSRLQRPGEAIVSVYARGRDYHKVMRSRLQKLGERIALHVEKLGHRAFTDSAPVLEAELAARSGQGWRGKHTLVLDRAAGSMFFLGEIYVDLALPHSAPVSAHCGSCSACMDVCPTQAIVAPYRLDARRCISYLTIEHAGPIPLEFRAAIGNRIYGCDDCQLVCPWNKFAQRSALPDFDERQGLSGQQLVTLFAWTEAEFLSLTEGSAIRRIGHERWLRNIALALGNALRAGHDGGVREALLARQGHASEVVREQIGWALQAHAK